MIDTLSIPSLFNRRETLFVISLQEESYIPPVQSQSKTLPYTSCGTVTRYNLWFLIPTPTNTQTFIPTIHNSQLEWSQF